MKVRMDDGTEREFGPGEVSYVPPGHDAWVVGNEPFVAVDFTGMKEYAASTSKNELNLMPYYYIVVKNMGRGS